MQRKDIYWIGYRCVFEKTKTLFNNFIKKNIKTENSFKTTEHGQLANIRTAFFLIKINIEKKTEPIMKLRPLYALTFIFFLLN